jgi:deazaflavin-dependent oxidoreductase (nitroreductase family)
MPLSRTVARFNVRVTNKVTRPFAAWLPGFGVIRHVGRRSGRQYETPVSVFWDGDHYVVALTYGSGSEWVKNVLAAGGAVVRTKGKAVEVTDPVLFTDADRSAVPRPVRAVLGAIDVDEFLRLRPVT